MAEKRSADRRFYCLGCGLDITDRTSDRRNVKEYGIIDTWTDLMLTISPDSDQSILKHTIEEEGKMCRKCYTAYSRLFTLRKKLLDSLQKAKVTIEVSCPTKRQRLSVPPSLSQTRSSSSNSVSPGVAVSRCMECKVTVYTEVFV